MIREFVCKECGHQVVVNPQLPPDYTPTVCTQCWNQIVKPRHERLERRISRKVTDLLKLLGVKK